MPVLNEQRVIYLYSHACAELAECRALGLLGHTTIHPRAVEVISRALRTIMCRCEQAAEVGVFE